MSAAPPPPIRQTRAALTALAERARRRLLLREFLSALARSAWIPWLAVPLILVFHRWVRAESLAAATLILWSGLASAAAWRRRHSAYGALAAWDDQAGRHDALSSAFIFSTEPATADDPGRQLHLDRAEALASQAASQLRNDMPLPPLRWTWLGPLAAIAVSLMPWWRPVVDSGDRPLTDDQVAAAAAAADRLHQPESQALAAKPELTDAERRALEELARAQKEVAEALRNAGGKSPRDVLEELEKQARAAEALAKQLGADPNAWASDSLLQELRQHPDTSELADAVIDKQPARAAEEARDLADRLKSPELTSEVGERLKSTFTRALEKANPDERSKPVDRTVAAAEQDMKQDQAPAAGEKFEQLAESFDRQAERDKAREALDAMAERLREAGSAIMGQKGEGLKKLAGQPGEPNASPMPSLQPLGATGDPSAAGDPLQLPGPSDPSQRPGEPAPRRGTPIPGTGPPPPNAKPLAAIPGTAPKDGKPLGLATPIPGTVAGQRPVPIPGSGGQSGPPVAGGTQAGRGASENGNKPTELAAAAAQGEVAASPGTDGESFTQSIEGQPREEAVARAARQSAAQFLKEQEQALDLENLPPSRREQIRRYFESLRKKIGE